MTEQEQKAFEQMREALKQAMSVFRNPRWGCYDYMESSRVYEDASKAATVIDAAITAANAVSHPQATETQVPKKSSEHQYAKHLCIEMARKFYPESAQFRPQSDLLGVLTQIDNMVAGLVRPQKLDAHIRRQEC